jgi:hypothetical protein
LSYWRSGHPFDNIDDWGLTIASQREAATSDQMLCGLAVAEFKDAIVVLNVGRYQINNFLVPKSKVDGFDGTLGHLKISQTNLFLFCF